MENFRLLENGGKRLLESGTGFRLLETQGEISIGGSGGKRRRSRIEGSTNYPVAEIDPRRRRLARQNATIMVLLH